MFYSEFEAGVKELKKLFKKYKNISTDLKNLQKELHENPKTGIELTDLENISDTKLLSILRANGL